jgi:hypothetical protein
VLDDLLREDAIFVSIFNRRPSTPIDLLEEIAEDDVLALE